MKRSTLIFGFTMFLLSAAWTNTFAQKAEIRNFHGTVNPQRTISLAWWSVGDVFFVNQTIEYSTDGVTFKALADLPVTGGDQGAIYQYLHSTPVVGVNYYRLILHFSDGSSELAGEIKVVLGQPPVYNYPTKPSNGSRPRG